MFDPNNPNQKNNADAWKFTSTFDSLPSDSFDKSQQSDPTNNQSNQLNNIPQNNSQRPNNDQNQKPKMQVFRNEQDDEKKKQQNRNQFYQKILSYQTKIPQYQFNPYKKQIKKNIFIKDMFDLSFFGYMAYNIICTKKPWFDLTANYKIIGASFLVFFYANIWFARSMNKNNYEFYKRNQQLLDNILTKEDKQQIRLSQLIAKYQ